MGAPNPLQTCVFTAPHGRVVAVDSAYHADATNTDRDVVVNASYGGVLPARFIAAHRPRGVIGVDCGVGPQGASIAGLWYFEAFNIAACVADVMTTRLGDGVDLYENGLISFVNQPAQSRGVKPGMSVRDAALALLDPTPLAAMAAADVTNRQIMVQTDQGRQIVCTDSIAFALPEDTQNVLVTAGHTGRSAVPYLRASRPFGFICSDGGMGRENSGVSGLHAVVADGLAGATVDARRARMGDGLSSYYDGIISAANELALNAGVRIGMTAPEAALLLVNRKV